MLFGSHMTAMQLLYRMNMLHFSTLPPRHHVASHQQPHPIHNAPVSAMHARKYMALPSQAMPATSCRMTSCNCAHSDACRAWPERPPYLAWA